MVLAVACGNFSNSTVLPVSDILIACMFAINSDTILFLPVECYLSREGLETTHREVLLRFVVCLSKHEPGEVLDENIVFIVTLCYQQQVHCSLET